MIIVVPLLAAFLTPLIGMRSAKARNVFVVISLLFVAFLVFLLARDIYANGLHIYTLGALSPDLTIPEHFMVPVRVILEVDSMSIFMGIITAIIALAAVIYSLSFMREETGQNRFYTLLLLLAAGTFGVAFTGDLFNMFVFLEIASISGAALVAFRIRFGDAPEGGFKYITFQKAQEMHTMLTHLGNNGISPDEFMEWIDAFTELQARRIGRHAVKVRGLSKIRCPKCKTGIGIYPANSGPYDQVGGPWNSQIFCMNTMDCGFELYMKTEHKDLDKEIILKEFEKLGV